MATSDPIARAGRVIRQFVEAWDLPLDEAQAATLGAYILEWFEWKPNDSNYPRTRPGAPRESRWHLPLNPEDLDLLVVMVLWYAPTDLPMDRVADLVAKEIVDHARRAEQDAEAARAYMAAWASPHQSSDPPT